MIFRFSLYGFLKNQRYFEPFFILYCIERGLNFTDIGLLIGFRELSIFLFEIPSGALADTIGRKRVMVTSFFAYTISFALFFISENMPAMFIGMLFFAIGETFRTGTHKAIIFSWLRKEKRESEKTTVYGFTRSWSKLGSACSIPISALIVYFLHNYSYCFLVSIFPCILNIVNLATYPEYLEENKLTAFFSVNTVKNTMLKLYTSLKKTVKKRELRQILIEAMNYEGLYKTAKDYIQPLLQSLAASIMLLSSGNQFSNNALVFGVVFIFLHITSAVASRNAGRFENLFNNSNAASRILWIINGSMFGLFTLSLYFGYHIIEVLIFIVLAILQNLWRPILISRCSSKINTYETATILSIESQVKSLFTMMVAPVLGFIVDYTGGVNEKLRFMPIGIIGIIIPCLILIRYYSMKWNIDRR